MNEELRKLLQDTLAELEDREWTYTGDDYGGGASVYCQSCSAHNGKKGTYGIEVPSDHTTECSLKSVMDRIKSKLAEG